MSSGSEEEEEAEHASATLEALRNDNAAVARSIKEELAARETLAASLAKVRARNARLRSDYEALTSGGDAMFLQLEQQRARRMGLLWWCSMLLTLAWTLGALQRESLGWALLNFCAFLFVWRGLYVSQNAAPMVAALLLALITLKFA